VNTEQYISVCSLFDPIFPETDSGFAGGGVLMIIFIHRYASAVYAMGLCLSVCLCLSQVGVLLKWLNVGSKKTNYTIVHRLWFSDAKDLHEIQPG